MFEDSLRKVLAQEGRWEAYVAEKSKQALRMSRASSAPDGGYTQRVCDSVGASEVIEFRFCSASSLSFLTLY